MGLLDGILSNVLGAAGGQGAMAGGAAANPLIQAAGALLNNNSAVGGLGGLVGQFEQAGLGHIMQSWISGGQNLPISPQQITQVLGSGTLQQLAQSAGVDTSQIGGLLAQVLPHMVDHLTPNGQIPAGGVTDAMGALGKLLGN